MCILYLEGEILNMIYARTILKSIITSTEEYPVTLITGARQVGKSTVVSYFETKGYKYISFDDTELLKKAKENPKKFIEEQGFPIIIDEIQRAKELFIEIENIVNKTRREKGTLAANGMYILTGSQKFHLMKGVSESLSGRVGIIEMEPLSQAEIRNWKEQPFIVDLEQLSNKVDDRYLSDDDLYLSIVRGFYPARWEIEGKPINNYYSNYLRTFIERDVRELINIKDLNKFENFIKVLASTTGEELNINNISKIVGIDNKTVESWLSILIVSNIITILEPYYEDSINKRIVKTKKIYFNDTGFACYLIGIDSPKALKLSSFKGRIFETYIHNEIRKSFKNNMIDVQMFYYRDNNQNEIDFILLKDGNLYLIEAKSGKQYGIDDVKAFKQLENTKYNIAGKCILCCSNEMYKISSQIYAFPIKCI